MSFATRNGLKTKTRKAMIEVLQARLFDAIDLGARLKHAHWNVKGPQFIALHELFGRLHEQAEEHADELAERLVALGGVASGTLAAAVKGSSLPAASTKAVSGKEHLAAVADALAGYGKGLRSAIDAADEADDDATEDLFTSLVREADKALWLVEAHLQAEA